LILLRNARNQLHFVTTRIRGIRKHGSEHATAYLY
jgi:hypothetical protein